MWEKILEKIKYGTALPAIIMLLLASITLGVYYIVTKDDRTVKSVEVGETIQLVSNTNLDTSIEGIEWKSSDVNVATVTSDGTVKAISPGDVNIRLTIDGETIDKYRVIVYTYNKDGKETYIPVTKLDLFPKDNNMFVGSKINLSAKITPDDATNKEIKWSSSNQNIATVNQSGEVTAISEGTADITVSSANNITSTAKVTVSKKQSTTPISGNKKEVSSISIDQGNNGLFKVGVTKQLTATILPANATNKTVTWSSDKPKIASVDKNGKVKMNAEGIATITATSSNGKKAYYVISVNSYVNPELSVNTNPIYTAVGNTIQLNASNNTGSPITYKSSNNVIATVDNNGNVKTNRTGSTTITITSDDITKKVNVNVTGYRIHFIGLDQSGDAILLESDGKFAMIDAGTQSAQQRVKKYLDDLNVKHLDFLIITHPHIDHNGSIAYLLNSGIKINTIYQKEYTFKDSTAFYGSTSTKDRVNNIINLANKYGTKIVYVDKTFKEGQSITLGNIKIYFYNVIQRVVTTRGENEQFNYETSQYWVNKTENPNSIANLIVANNHTLLTTGDITDNNILNGIISRVSAITNYLDVYKISHHGYYNCTGQKDLTINAKYYIATNSINTKFGDGNYALSNTEVNYNGEILKACFAYMHLDMCNVHFSNDATNSIIVNFSNSNTILSGGGLGRNTSNRCR